MVEQKIHPFDKPDNWTSQTNACDWLGYDLRHVPATLRTIRRERGEGADFSSERLLCLGAGQADQELAVANQLGIPHGNVVLLDLHFSEAAKERIDLEAPSATRVEQGLFTYLQNPNGMRFSIVTTFGLFDILNREHLDEFLRLVPNVLSDNALVFVFSQEADHGIHGDKGPKEERIRKLALEHGLSQLGLGNFPYEFKFNRSQQESEKPNLINEPNGNMTEADSGIPTVDAREYLKTPPNESEVQKIISSPDIALLLELPDLDVEVGLALYPSGWYIMRGEETQIQLERLSSGAQVVLHSHTKLATSDAEGDAVPSPRDFLLCDPETRNLIVSSLGITEYSAPQDYEGQRQLRGVVNSFTPMFKRREELPEYLKFLDGIGAKHTVHPWEEVGPAKLAELLVPLS